MKLSLTLLGAALIVPGAFAATLTLNPTHDARILSFNTSGQEGQNGPLSLYNAPGNIQRTLLNFDLSSLNGATITSARVRLYGAAYSGSTASTVVRMFRVTKDWTENQVSWNQAANSDPWTNPGGDFVGKTGVQNSNAYSTTATPQQGYTLSWYQFDATDVLQDLVSGAYANYGIMLTSDEGCQLHFVSREGISISGNMTEYPELVVDYEPVPEPMSLLVLGGVGLAAWAKRRRA